MLTQPDIDLKLRPLCDTGITLRVPPMICAPPWGRGAGYTASKFAVVGYSEALYYELLATGNSRIGVSVLCPAAVATRIVDSGRNRPAGPQEQPAPGTPEAAMLDMIRQVLAAGQSPAEVAGKVLDAIVAGRFYILTHPEHNGVITKRAEAMLAGMPPPAIGMA